MAYIPAINTCQAELFYTWDGQQCETVLHYIPDDPLTITIMPELGASLVSWWDIQIQPDTPTNLTFRSIKFTDLTSQIGPTITYAAGLPLVGIDASASLPNNCALVITKRTVLRGRSYRGRIYHPGLCEGDVIANAVTPAFVVSMVARYEMIRVLVTASTTWRMAVVSRFTNGNPRVAADVNPVSSFDSDGSIDSQRRRLPGRGA